MLSRKQDPELQPLAPKPESPRRCTPAFFFCVLAVVALIALSVGLWYLLAQAPAQPAPAIQVDDVGCGAPEHWLHDGKSEQCLDDPTEELPGGGGQVGGLLCALKKVTPGGRVMLVAGTALAWYRNCKTFKHDHDVDVALFPEDFQTVFPAKKKELAVAMKDCGLEVPEGFDGSEGFVESLREDGVTFPAKFIILDGTARSWAPMLDVHVMHSNSSHFLYYIPHSGIGGPDRTLSEARKRQHPRTQYQKVTFHGVEVYAPYPAERYFEQIYVDWRNSSNTGAAPGNEEQRHTQTPGVCQTCVKCSEKDPKKGL